MAKENVLHVYLPAAMSRDAAAGRVNIINRIAAAVAPYGWRMSFHNDDVAELAKAPSRTGRALFHMIEPVVNGGLTLRRAYHYPFWQIEATAARGQFDVALAEFKPAEIDTDMAKSFCTRLRERVLANVNAVQWDYIFMPLQGRISVKRSFQSMSPLAMIEATLRQDPGRDIRATLHPKETYDSEDRAGLSDLARRYPRFRIVQDDPTALLRGCDYVVTQNSAVALDGCLLRKPAVLFAEVDFHHIAGSVPRDGLAAAFAAADGPKPDFSAYLYWFFKMNTINAGAPEAEDQIIARLVRHGWLT
jgi:hypothetical protein